MILYLYKHKLYHDRSSALIYTRPCLLRVPYLFIYPFLRLSPLLPPPARSGCRWRLMQCRKLIGFIGAVNNILQGRAGSFSLDDRFSSTMNRSYRLAPHFPSLLSIHPFHPPNLSSFSSACLPRVLIVYRFSTASLGHHPSCLLLTPFPTPSPSPLPISRNETTPWKNCLAWIHHARRPSTTDG